MGQNIKDVLVGEVLKAHGVQGELRVYPITHDSTRFKKLKELALSDGTTQEVFKITKAKVQQEMVYLTLEGISSRDAAEKYRGWKVYIDRSDVLPLKDRWYYFELEGLHVYEGEEYLGVLKRVLETGANDVYLVEGARGEICIPALKSVILNVDINAGRMEVKLPPGLLED